MYNRHSTVSLVGNTLSSRRRSRTWKTLQGKPLFQKPNYRCAIPSRLSCRPTYFRDLQQFIVTIPHDVHEALVSPIISSMDRAFQAMPLSRGPHSILLEVDGNASVDGENITAVPDVCVRISSWRSTPQLAAMREYIFVETAFTQPETQVTHKLKEYITSHPHTLAVMKIMIKESRFSSPSNSSELADRFSGTNVLSNEAWRPEPTHTRPFRVVRDGFTWIDITGVNIEIWMREGETPIDLEVNEPGHPETAYAAGVSTSPPNSSCSKPFFVCCV